MNEWILAGLIFWLGTGALVVAGQFAEGFKARWAHKRKYGEGEGNDS